MTKYCPKCDAEMEYIEPEPDVGISGGYFCNACDHTEQPDDDEDVMSGGDR